MIRTIARRYAKALVQLAEEQNAVDAVKADFQAFSTTVRGDASLQKLFASPVFTPADKKAIISELAERLNLQPASRRFMAYLAETGRIRYVNDVHDAFLAILAEKQNRASVAISTAVELAADDLEDIKAKLEALTGKKVDIATTIDPSLIGGARAQIGSVVYDGTIKNQLNKMRSQLMN